MGIKKTAKKQAPALSGLTSIIIWVAEQAFPNLLGQGMWGMIPFLEIGLLLIAFSLGKNFPNLYNKGRRLFEPIRIISFYVDAYNSSKGVFIKFQIKKNFVNPKLKISIYKNNCGAQIIGEPCEYALFGQLEFKENATLNNGDTKTINVLHDELNVMIKRADPRRIIRRKDFVVRS